MPLHVEFVGELAFILLGFFLNVQFKGGDNLFSGWAVSGQGVHEPLNTRFRRGANDDVGLRGDALLSIKQPALGFGSLDRLADVNQDRDIVSVDLLKCDEIWSFVGAKDKNVPSEKRDQFGIGSVWTWTAIDADTKTCAVLARRHAR